MNKAMISIGCTPSAPTIPFRIVVPSMTPHARRARTLISGTVIKSKWMCLLRGGDESRGGEMMRAEKRVFRTRRRTKSGIGTEEGNMIMISLNRATCQ